MNEKTLRKSIIEACREMNRIGLNQGTSGNISVRYKDVMLITPSAIPYDSMEIDDICAMPFAGKEGAHEGPLPPSTEWRMHMGVMRGRPDVGAVVHAHPTYATVLAIARKPIPPVHYMMAAFGGVDVRCSRYETFGTKELAVAALEALEGRNACLLANHGILATGANLAKAMWLAVELETIARQYYLTLSIGGPVLLTEEQIEETRKKFATYGLKQKAEA